jgi:hypothetical protein
MTAAPVRDRHCERRHVRGPAAPDDEAAQDLRWIAFELRRSRAALRQVLALSRDLTDDDPRARRLRLLASDALVLDAADPRD